MPIRSARPALAAAALLSLAGAASAELPAVLDFIPSDSYGGIVAPSLASLDRSAQNLFAAVGMPVLTTPSQLFAEMGFVAGLDVDRPFAVAMIAGPMDGDEPPLAMFVPTIDYQAMINGFGAAPAEGGVSSMMINGDPVYAKQINGGYALIGPLKDAIAEYEPADGQMDAHAERMGASAMHVAENSQVFGFINMPAIEPLLADEWDQFREGVVGGMEMNPAAMGADDEAINNMADELTSLARDFVEDGLYGVFGMQADAMGVGMQMGMDFEPGSETAAMFNDPGDSQALLAKLPDRSFIFAFAIDNSTEGFKRLQALAEDAMAFGGGDAGMGDLMNLMQGAEGTASALYPTPGGMMGGLFAGMVNYTQTDAPGEYVDQLAQLAEGAEPGAMSMTFTRGETQLDGMPVHGWTAGMNMDPNNPASMQMMQMSQMLFGGPQISGYLIEGQGGVYQTMSRNLALVQGIAGGENTLASSQSLKQVRDMLPGPAVAEGYLGVRALYEMLSPMAAMFGMPIQTQVPEDLPPVGGAMSIDNGGFRAGMFTPAPVLRVGVALGMEFQAMQGGGGQNWQDDQGAEEAPF